MAANPQILQDLHEYVASKTGKPVTGGEPKTGGEKVKPKGRVPLPTNPDDPVQRQKFAEQIRINHNLPHGYGDTFLHMDEIPGTTTDSLTTRQIMTKLAPVANLPPALLHASSFEEGMSGLYPRTIGKEKDQVDFSGNEKFPVNGFVNFGLDNFSDAYNNPNIRKYLPADFNKQFVKSVATNEKGQKVNSANFLSAEAAATAKAAMLRNAQDEVSAYAAKNKIPLSDKAKQFFTLVHYNAGPGNAQKMLSDYNKSGALTNDAFMTARPVTGPGLTATSWQQPYDNVARRFQLANASTFEGQFDEPTPSPVVQTK